MEIATDITAALAHVDNDEITQIVRPAIGTYVRVTFPERTNSPEGRIVGQVHFHYGDAIDVRILLDSDDPDYSGDDVFTCFDSERISGTCIVERRPLFDDSDRAWAAEVTA